RWVPTAAFPVQPALQQPCPQDVREPFPGNRSPACRSGADRNGNLRWAWGLLSAEVAAIMTVSLRESAGNEDCMDRRSAYRSFRRQYDTGNIAAHTGYEFGVGGVGNGVQPHRFCPAGVGRVVVYEQRALREHGHG